METTEIETAACIGCEQPTTETITGTIGQRHGVMCTDCQYWLDGNLDVR